MPDGRDSLLRGVFEAIVAIARTLPEGRRHPFAETTLTSTQLRALFLLAHSSEPVTPGALASRLGVSAGAVTQAVQPVRAAGLVERVPNPEDARSTFVRLTDAARRVIDAFESREIARLRWRFDALSDSDLAVLLDLLRKVELRA